MKRLLHVGNILFVLCILLLTNNLFAQVTWNWNSYPTGSMSYNQSNGSCSLNTVISGSDFAQTPRYTTSYGTGLLIDHNWTNTSTSTTITLTFNTPITNPSFQIRDINQNGPCMAFCSSAWDDKVVVSANSGTISASSTNPPEHTITGNGTGSVTADANLVCNSTNAAVTFNITGSVTSITISYQSGNNPSKSTASGSPTPSCGNSNESLCFSSRSACTDPGRQYIAIGEIAGTMCCSGGTASINAGTDQSICAGQSVTLSASGGSSYSWNNGVQNGVPFTPSATTTYTVTGTSSGGCSGTDNVTVTVKPLPTISAGPDQTICAGQSVILAGSGGTTYSWSNSVQNGLAFFPTATQTYTVTGTGSNGCTNTDQVQVTVNSTPNVNAGNDISVCAGQSVTLTATGATNLTWTGGIQNTTPFTPTTTNTYIVTGNNSSGCSDKDTVVVTVLPIPIINAGNDTSVCSGTNVLLSASGGVSYQWDNSVPNGTSVLVTQTSTFTVTGMSSNNCSATDSKIVTLLPGVSVFAGNDTTICRGSSIVLNGTGSGTLSWNNNLVNGSTQFPVTTTTYQLSSPAQGSQCAGYDEVIITVRNNPTVQATDQSACEGDTVIFSASGAQSYEWTNGILNGISFIAQNSLTPQVIGTDNFGCKDTVIVNLLVNPLPNVNAGPDQSICPGNSVTLTATGANNYSWTNSIQNGIAFSPTQSNLYIVTGTTNLGCSNKDTVQVLVQQGQLAINAGNDQTVCEGAMVVLNATGASTYTWDHTIQNGVPFSVSQTDVYTVTGYDANGCFGTDQLTIYVNSYPSFQLASSNPTQCSFADGQIQILGLNAGQNYLVSYNNSVPTNQTIPSNGTLIFSNLSPGNYSIFSVNSNGCITIDSTLIQLIPPSSPSLNAGIDQTICFGDSIQLQAQASAGSTVTWNNGSTNYDYIAPAVGTYSWIAEATMNGCSSIDTILIQVRPIPNVFAGNDLTICEGETVLLTGSGGTTYNWSNPVTNGVAFLPPVGTNYYSVTSSNSYGCFDSDTIQIIVKANPLLSIVPSTNFGCLPFNQTFYTTGNPGGQCFWSINGQLINGSCDSLTYNFTSAGCYDLNVTTELEGCSGNVSFPNIICLETPPISNFSTLNTGVSELNNSINFLNLSSNASSYYWDFGDQSTSILENPHHDYTLVQEDTLSIMLIAYSLNGCADTSYQLLPYKEDLIFWVPNAFTPNNDGTNDVFSPVFTSGYDPYDYSLLIFNRWGEILFESHDVLVGWKGTYGGEVMQDDVYTWKISFKTKYNDEHKVLHGHATLLK